jgi:hypothetical protein
VRPAGLNSEAYANVSLAIAHRSDTSTRAQRGSEASTGEARKSVALDDALAVEADECDHVVDVVVGLDPPRSEAGAAWEHRMVVDASLLE